VNNFVTNEMQTTHYAFFSKTDGFSFAEPHFLISKMNFLSNEVPCMLVQRLWKSN